MIAKICQRKSIITWKVKEKWLNENFLFFFNKVTFIRFFKFLNNEFVPRILVFTELSPSVLSDVYKIPMHIIKTKMAPIGKTGKAMALTMSICWNTDSCMQVASMKIWKMDNHSKYQIQTTFRFWITWYIHTFVYLFIYKRNKLEMNLYQTLCLTFWAPLEF